MKLFTFDEPVKTAIKIYTTGLWAWGDLKRYRAKFKNHRSKSRIVIAKSLQDAKQRFGIKFNSETDSIYRF
jgi:hypothetical protein